MDPNIDRLLALLEGLTATQSDVDSAQKGSPDKGEPRLSEPRDTRVIALAINVVRYLSERDFLSPPAQRLRLSFEIAGFAFTLRTGPLQVVMHCLCIYMKPESSLIPMSFDRQKNSDKPDNHDFMTEAEGRR
ncbi:hypothetical protein LZL87_003298 [Fusarium oxysporum]|nr:hypothetical protein LZL87_003298 [Fusarium oxysporum]